MELDTTSASRQAPRGLAAIRHLDYTAIFCRDMPAMRKFYGEVMGFELHRTLGDSWIEYRVGASILALTRRSEKLFNDAPPPPGTLSLQLAFRVAPHQVDECAAEFRVKGVPIVYPPTDHAWGHRTLFVRDPDGNVVEIYAEI
jgi:lactoylglutathione lyase